MRPTNRWGMLSIALVGAAAPGRPPSADPPACWIYQTADARFRLELVAKGLNVPVSLAFLPGGHLALLAERAPGRLSYLDLTSGAVTPIAGMPQVVGTTDGGLQDVVLHPDFPRNGWVYVAYSEPTAEGNALVVERATLRGRQIGERHRIFTARPYLKNNDFEFGSRLVIDRGSLYITVGQRDSTRYPQRLDSHLGKIVRVRLDGSVPPDNPFAGRPGALPEIWSYGHRNPQGLAVNPVTGELWETEHGPRGGDEINVIRKGRNYGWPVITYGIEYSGEPVGQGRTAQPGLEQPRYGWVPSIAPSGMAFYSGAGFPKWRGSLFVGAMAYRHLNRVVIEGGRVVREERLLRDRGWRVREVRQAPDGSLYIGVDSGYVARLRPDDGRRSCARGIAPEDPLQRLATTGPPIRSAHLAYDGVRHVAVALGVSTAPGPARSELWEWNGVTWRSRPGALPPLRTGGAMTQDPKTGIVLFGGRDAGGAPLGDTWRYADSTWTRLPVTGPSPRYGAGVAWDFDHTSVILFGGVGASGAVSGETWRWDGTHWDQRPGPGPPARRDAAMAYDPTTRSVVLFGGVDASGKRLGDTWTWTGNGWRRLSGGMPPARDQATLIYSWTRRSMLLIGGRSDHGNELGVWALTSDWDMQGAHWWRTSLTLPAARLRVVADQDRSRLVFIGDPGASPVYLMVR